MAMAFPSKFAMVTIALIFKSLDWWELATRRYVKREDTKYTRNMKLTILSAFVEEYPQIGSR